MAVEPSRTISGGQGPAIQVNSFGNRWAIVALMLLGFLPLNEAGAYMAMRVGLSSNLLIRDGRVYFVQSDEGITALDLATGDLIARKSDRAYVGRLSSHDSGIVCDGRDEVSLLDPDTLDTIWHETGVYATYLADSRHLTCKDNQLTCRDLATGEVLWSRVIPGRPSFLESGDYVLLECTADLYSSDINHVLLISLINGDVWVHQSASEDRCFAKAYFDSRQVYILSGPEEPGHEPEGYSGYDTKGCTPDTLTTWDLTGTLIGSVKAPDQDLITDTPGYIKAFTHMGLRFYEDGRVQPAGIEIAPELPYGTYQFATATATIRHLADASTTEQATVIAWESDSASWQGYVPHMDRHGVIDIQTNGRYVIVGTVHGLVECIDTYSGQSRWLYVFPSHLATLSYSSPNGLPPHATSLRAEFIRDNRHEFKARPMIRLPDGFDLDTATDAQLRALPTNTSSRIVYDPDPYDAFAWLPPYVRTVWGLFSLSVVLAAGLFYVFAWRRRKGLVLATGLTCLVGLPVVTLYRFARVSSPATLCLKLLILGLIACSVVLVWLALKDRRSVPRISASVCILLGLLLIGRYAFRLLRYA